MREYDDFNQPMYVNVPIDEYQKMKEKIEDYETTLRMIKESAEGVILNYIEELENELEIDLG